MRENNTIQVDDEDGQQEEQQQEQYASPKRRRPQHLINLPPLPGLGISQHNTQTRSQGLHNDNLMNYITPPRQHNSKSKSTSQLSAVSDSLSPAPSLVAATPYRSPPPSSKVHQNSLHEKNILSQQTIITPQPSPKGSTQSIQLNKQHSLPIHMENTPLINNRKSINDVYNCNTKLINRTSSHFIEGHSNNDEPQTPNENDNGSSNSHEETEEDNCSISILTDDQQSTSDWTLQTFLNDIASPGTPGGLIVKSAKKKGVNNNNEKGKGVNNKKFLKKGSRGDSTERELKNVKRRLSLSSNHSYIPKVESEKKRGEDNKIPRRILSSLSSFGVVVGDEDRVSRKRRMSYCKLLLIVCLAIVALSYTFLSNTPANLILSSFKDQEDVANDSSTLTSSKSNSLLHQAKETGAQDTSGGEEWHPLFQHGQRTANMDVEVPTNHPKAPILSNREIHQKKIQDFRQQSSPQTTIEDYQGTSHRRLDDTALFTSSSNKETRQEEGTANFLNGQVTQELCPAVHTLISQSLIIRSSYGNIFSITTPPLPGGSIKRNGDRVSKPTEGPSESPGVKIVETPASESTLNLFKRHKRVDKSPAPSNRNLFSHPDKKKDNLFSHRGEEIIDLDEEEESSSSNLFDYNTRHLQSTTGNNIQIGSTGGSFADTGDYDDIDTETESVYDGTGVETITIKTLSLRMSDFQPELGTHFEVWVYTGSGSNIELNENDLDDDPTNDNTIIPSKVDYTEKDDEGNSGRAKFSDWSLVADGYERELIPDTEFFDNNGHIFNIGAATTIGPIGRLDKYENMEEVTIKARQWNDGKIRSDGGMDAITAEGEVTETFFYKIPESKFTELKLPKNNGKLTLFVTLDRVGLQYGYAAKQEFDQVDVMKHDYIDQTPSLDVLNGNVNMRMHVGEGVIFYPWVKEQFFYQTRRFLGKIWYDAKIPCEYMPQTEVIDIPEEEGEPTFYPTLIPTNEGTNVSVPILLTVLVKDEVPPMPVDVKEIFEDTVADFVDDNLGDFCPLTWNVGAEVTDQSVSSNVLGSTTPPGTVVQQRRDGNGHSISSRREPDIPPDLKGGGSSRYLRELIEPIFYKPMKQRARRIQAITAVDADTTFDALYDGLECPNKTPEEFAQVIEDYINDNEPELLKELKAKHDYFKDAFSITADSILPDVVSEALAEEEDENKAAIIGGIIAALLLCCFCCCLPFLILRRKKRKEEKQNEIVGEDVEWARPVDDDHFPPLGGYYGDDGIAGGDGTGTGYDSSRRRKRPDGEIPESGDSGPPLNLKPIPPGINPPEDDSEMIHDVNWNDREEPTKDKKKRPFGRPGRMPDEGTPGEDYNINIYPGGDVGEETGYDEDLNLRHVEKTKNEHIEGDWKPEHYEPDGGVHAFGRDIKETPAIKPRWQRLAKKKGNDTSTKKLTIKQKVLKRRKELGEKMAQMRHVERVEAGLEDSDEEQVFPKAEPDSRIEDLMGRIKAIETDRVQRYQRKGRQMGESDYEIWRRLNIGEDDLSSSDESDSDEDPELAAARRKRKKKKRRGADYLLNFDDLDAYNRALAVHEDAYIHRWVQVKVEKGAGEDEGANLEDIEINNDEEYALNEDGVEVDRYGRPRPKIPRQTEGDLGDEDDAAAASIKLRPVSPRQKTAGDDEDDTAAMYANRLRSPRQDTGDIGDEDDAPQAGPDKRSLLSKQKTEYIGSINDFSSSMSRQGATKFGGLEGVEDEAVDRRSSMSRQSAVKFGGMEGLKEEGVDTSTPSDDRRSTLSKQKTEYIGSINDFSDEGDDKQTGYRKTAMARSSATKFDSVREEGDDESEDELSEGDF